MYAPLIQLEHINTTCRIQLTKTLSTQHKVRVFPGRGEITEDGCRGLAFYLAFEPWQTCLKCPPKSARFFDAAKNNGLLRSEEAKSLSQALIRHGAAMARAYNGVFSPYFSSPDVRTILDNVDDLDHLAESALAVGTSWADRLYELCPFPLQPLKHLEVQSFRRITTEGEIEFYSQAPWLAWVEALDLICCGPWAGLRPDHIMQMVQALENRIARSPENPIGRPDAVLAHKVVLPMFSRGLQGVVFGLFTDVAKSEIEPILSSLLQFGETISDVYADLRWQQFVDMLEHDLDGDALAREVINVTSPIAKIVVTREGRRTGYKIADDRIYLCGYERLAGEELGTDGSDCSFTVAGPNGEAVYIEPLTDIPNFSPYFARTRIENYLNLTFGSISTKQNENLLPLIDVQELRVEYEIYAAEKGASLAKLRQFYVISKVEQHWQDGSVKITNNELKRFFEGHGREAKNGYQVTSFAAEFERIFTDRVTATKTRNALSLSWAKDG